MKIVLRPKISAKKPHTEVPKNSPKKSAAIKLAIPVMSKKLDVVVVKMPSFTSPGAM